VTAPPAAASKDALFEVLVSRQRDETDAAIIATPMFDETLHSSLADVHPTPTMAVEERLRSYCQRTLGRLLASLRPDAEHALRQAGFLLNEQ
jgi:hypothetical protein